MDALLVSVDLGKLKLTDTRTICLNLFGASLTGYVLAIREHNYPSILGITSAGGSVYTVAVSDVSELANGVAVLISGVTATHAEYVNDKYFTIGNIDAQNDTFEISIGAGDPVWSAGGVVQQCHPLTYGPLAPATDVYRFVIDPSEDSDFYVAGWKYFVMAVGVTIGLDTIYAALATFSLPTNAEKDEVNVATDGLPAGALATATQTAIQGLVAAALVDSQNMREVQAAAAAALTDSENMTEVQAAAAAALTDSQNMTEVQAAAAAALVDSQNMAEVQAAAKAGAADALDDSDAILETSIADEALTPDKFSDDLREPVMASQLCWRATASGDQYRYKLYRDNKALASGVTGHTATVEVNGEELFADEAVTDYGGGVYGFNQETVGKMLLPGTIPHLTATFTYGGTEHNLTEPILPRG